MHRISFFNSYRKYHPTDSDNHRKHHYLSERFNNIKCRLRIFTLQLVNRCNYSDN